VLIDRRRRVSSSQLSVVSPPSSPRCCPPQGPNGKVQRRATRTGEKPVVIGFAWAGCGIPLAAPHDPAIENWSGEYSSELWCNRETHGVALRKAGRRARKPVVTAWLHGHQPTLTRNDAEHTDDGQAGPADFESEGREFESLRARQSNQGLILDARFQFRSLATN
jgi:hypothetical protein